MSRIHRDRWFDGTAAQILADLEVAAPSSDCPDCTGGLRVGRPRAGRRVVEPCGTCRIVYECSVCGWSSSERRSADPRFTDVGGHVLATGHVVTYPWETR